MTPENQTKRRWLQSVLSSVDEKIPTREFPQEIRQEIQPRQVSKGFALRIRLATRTATAAH
jgi:hypothetical protein